MKIIFFDTWTKGIKHFSRLVPGIEKQGHSCKLIHLESWHGEIDRQQERIQNLDCIDISSYKTSFIYSLLKKEKPDMVLILSLSYLLDRTIVAMCQYLNIKVVYLAHGKIYMKEGVGNLEKNISISQSIISRIKKKQILILYNYLRFNLVIRREPSVVISTLKEFFLQPSESMYTAYSEEFHVDLGMVYYESEKKMFEQMRKFPRGIIHSVGNPEFDEVINTPLKNRKNFIKELSTPTGKYAVYFEDGFVEEGILSQDEWQSFITEIAIPLKQRGVSLIVKLHPRTQKSLFDQFFDENQICALNDVDLKNLVTHSEFLLSHSSSTIMYGLLLAKPVILPRWGALTHLIRNYPEDTVLYCNSVQEYAKAIDQKLSAPKMNDYLREHFSQADGKTTCRIVDLLTNV
jgi:hypothetical protein